MRRIPGSCTRSFAPGFVLPIHADDIDRGAAGLKVLILPNVGALSDGQAAAIRRFVQRGGSLFATGRLASPDEWWGDPRPDFALADLFGCHRGGDAAASRPTGGRGGGRTRSGVCAEPERPYLPAPQSGTALARRRTSRR